MTIITFDNEDKFIGICQFNGLFVVTLRAVSKTFKTLNGAKKFASKYGYNS